MKLASSSSAIWVRESPQARRDHVQHVVFERRVLERGCDRFELAPDVAAQPGVRLERRCRDQDRSAEVGREREPSRPPAHVLVLGLGEILERPPPVLPEHLPAAPVEDHVLGGQVHTDRECRRRHDRPDLTESKPLLDDFALLERRIRVVERHATLQADQQLTPGQRFVPLPEASPRGLRGGEAGAARQPLGQRRRGRPVGDEHEHLFASARERVGGGYQQLAAILGRRDQNLLRPLPLAVVLAVAEHALAKDALPQLHRPPRVDEQLRLQPLGEQRRLPEHGREPDHPWVAPRHLELGEEELQPRTPLVVGQHLQLVHDDEPDALNQVRLRDKQRLQLLVDHDGDLELASEDLPVEFPPIA